MRNRKLNCNGLKVNIPHDQDNEKVNRNCWRMRTWLAGAKPGVVQIMPVSIMFCGVRELEKVKFVWNKPPAGCLDSVEWEWWNGMVEWEWWNGMVEWWNGMVEWWNGMVEWNGEIKWWNGMVEWVVGHG
jgi:hypothetical protein